MRYAILAAMLFASPVAADDCQSVKDLYDTYSSTVNFALALSESCQVRSTTTCAEVIEPLQVLLKDISLDEIQFIANLREEKCSG